jgi:hypothetical protein
MSDPRRSLESPRERKVLHLLTRSRHLNTAHLEEFLFDGSDVLPSSRQVTTRRMLARLRKRGLIVSTTRLVGGPGGGSARLVWQLTDAGRALASALEPGPRTRRPPRSTLFIDHCLMTADVAIAFMKAARARPGHDLGEWASDWEAAERLDSSVVVPDAHFVYATDAWEFHACLEADLGTERPSRFAERIRQYIDAYRSGSWRARLPTWPLVLTVTPSAARAKALRRATEDVLRLERDVEGVAGATEFDFASLSDLQGPTGPLGAIWQVAGRTGLHALIPVDDQRPSGNGDRSARMRLLNECRDSESA